MPYGIMSQDTELALRAAGIDHEKIQETPEEGSAIDVSIVIEGALDESFLINVEADRKAVVDAIFGSISTVNPKFDFYVSADHVYVGDDGIEGSGFIDESYTRERHLRPEEGDS